MGMRRKEFVTKKAGTDDVVELVVNGTVFPCKSRIPGMVLVDFLSAMDMDDPKTVGDMLKGFFREAFKDGEVYDRFMSFSRDPDNEIGIEDLSGMAGWIAEQYGGGPTAGSQGSSGGTDTTSSGPAESPFSEASNHASLQPTN